MSLHRGSFYAVALLLAVSSVTAHICMWSPMQRADFNIGEPGYQGCYLKVGPCGTNSSGPITTVKAGQPFSVQFQQNLNHYYVSNPGWMDVSWAPTPTPQESDFQYIGPRIVDYNAMNEITQTNFSINVNIPNVPTSHGVLRVRYVSNNPLENDRGEIFYQCADISIIAADSPSESSVPTPTPDVPAAHAEGTPCCAPKQWVSQFYRVGAGTLNPIHGTIYYDAINKFMRVDTHAGSGGTIYDGNFQMYMNFSNGMEYYYSSFDNSCGLYGLDYWNDWCYGTTGESETYSTTVTYGDVPADVWQNGDFYFVNEQKSCLPMFLARSSSGDTTVYYNVNAGIPDPSVFNPPQVCLHQQHAASRSVSRSLQTGAAVPEHVRWLNEIATRMRLEH